MVSVIVLGLTGWLVTCFFGCSGARDALWLCYLRVPGALNADLVAMLGAPGLVTCLLYTSPSPRDVEESRMPSSA